MIRQPLATLVFFITLFAPITLAQNFAEVSLTATAVPAVIVAGNTVTYSLVVSNSGPNVAVNLWIADAIPSRTTFVSADPQPSLVLPNQVAFSLGNFAGSTFTNITVVYQTSEPGAITNYTYAFSETLDPSTTNNVLTTVNYVCDPLYISLNTLATTINNTVTSNADQFIAFTNLVSSNFVSQTQLQIEIAQLNNLISSTAEAGAATYGILTAFITNNSIIDSQNLEAVSNLLVKSVFGSDANLFLISSTNDSGLYGSIANQLAISSNAILASIASTYQTAASDAALATLVTNNATSSDANLGSVSNLLIQASFGNDTNLFSLAATNGFGLYGLLINELNATSNSIITTVANSYESSMAGDALATLVTNNAATESATLNTISNAFVQASFGSPAIFAILATNGGGLFGLLTNSLAATSNSILASLAGAYQTAATVASNLNSISNLLAQSGFGSNSNLFNLAATNGVGLYGLLTNYLVSMSNTIVASIVNNYETAAAATAAFQSQTQAASASNAALYSFIATNRLADNGQTLSACANGVSRYSAESIAYPLFLSYTSQSWHTNFQNADSIRLVYSTSTVGYPSGETYVPGTGPFELAAAVGYVQNRLTNWVMAHWNGAEIVLVNPNSKLISDDIGLSIPAGGTFMVRTWCNRDADNTFAMADGTRGLLSVQSPAFPVSGPYFRGGSGNLNNGNGVIFTGPSTAGSNPFTNTPFTLLTSGSPIPGSANEAFYPCAILGHSRIDEQTNIVIIGDSIANGNYDEFDVRLDGGVGFIREAVFGSFGFIQLTAGGEKLAHWLNESGVPARAPFILGASRIICELGCNDIALGTNLVSVEAEAVAVWSRLAKAGGGRVWATTLAPRSTSTDFFATTNGQLSYAKNDYTIIRNDYNNWLRSGAPIYAGVATTNGAPGARYAGQSGHPLTGAFDSGSFCEPFTNAGIWIAPPTNVYVGVATTATPTSYTDTTAHWSSTANFGCGEMAGYVLVDLTHSGAAVILSNTTNTLTFWSGLSITGLTNGDNVKIIAAATFDGIHPLPGQNTTMAAAISTAALK